MKIATWNVNSLTVRLEHVMEWLKKHEPDVLGLQEIKMTDDKFPLGAFQELGYNAVFSGQKTYNGVAIISKQKAAEVVKDFPDYDDEQRRVLATTIDGVRILNVYIPNGASLDSDKYQYKLAWLQQLLAYTKTQLAQYERVILMGDFNIAPADIDVHDPELWRSSVLCSEAERAVFQALIDLGLVDIFRTLNTDAQYSWWDYRQGAFHRNLGLRIDHILVNTDFASNCTEVGIDRATRKLERPSDHAPVWVNLVRH
jgi:exodeoxyribonuclease-3